MIDFQKTPSLAAMTHFVQRFRFHVVVSEEGAGSVIVIEKGMSGMMGGAIGYAKMNKELQRVRNHVHRSLG